MDLEYEHIKLLSLTLAIYLSVPATLFIIKATIAEFKRPESKQSTVEADYALLTFIPTVMAWLIHMYIRYN